MAPEYGRVTENCSKVLIADGFDEIVDIKDRKYQLKFLGIVWLILVLIVPMFTSGEYLTLCNMFLF